MTVRIENETCFFTTENGEEIRLCPDVTIVTDAEKAMSAVDLERPAHLHHRSRSRRIDRSRRGGRSPAFEGHGQ